MKNEVLKIFKSSESEVVPLEPRLAPVEALWQAGDPRLRLPRDIDYWVPAGT